MMTIPKTVLIDTEYKKSFTLQIVLRQLIRMTNCTVNQVFAHTSGTNDLYILFIYIYINLYVFRLPVVKSKIFILNSSLLLLNTLPI